MGFIGTPKINEVDSGSIAVCNAPMTPSPRPWTRASGIHVFGGRPPPESPESVPRCHSAFSGGRLSFWIPSQIYFLDVGPRCILFCPGARRCLCPRELCSDIVTAVSLI